MTGFVRDPVAEEARRHRLDYRTATSECRCGYREPVPGLRRIKLPWPHVEAAAFYTHACTCGESFIECSAIASYDAFDEHLDAAEHGELS